MTQVTLYYYISQSNHTNSLLKLLFNGNIMYMKQILKVLSVLVAPIVFVCTCLAGCKTDVEIDNGEIMRDINVQPEQKPAYEEYSRQAVAEYKAVAERHKTADGEVDNEDPEVVRAASVAAAKLYAYACYNERTLDKYAFFSHQEGDTDLGSNGSAKALKQEYYLRVNESENTCGYRYHYTIKKVKESSGIVGTFKGLFESARLRFTDKTDLLYRFEGDNIRISDEYDETLSCNLLECDWATGKDWGKPDIVMKKSEFIPPEKIEEDIVNTAGEDNVTIRGNINILAENIVASANIVEEDEGGYFIIMTLNTEVANSDEASLKMLRRANSSDNCQWVGTEEDPGVIVVFRLWENGLFRFYNFKERWSGKINGFGGVADSLTTYYYSYSDRDCDMAKNLEMLEKAKEQKG